MAAPAAANPQYAALQGPIVIVEKWSTAILEIIIETGPPPRQPQWRPPAPAGRLPAKTSHSEFKKLTRSVFSCSVKPIPNLWS